MDINNLNLSKFSFLKSELVVVRKGELVIRRSALFCSTINLCSTQLVALPQIIQH